MSELEQLHQGTMPAGCDHVLRPGIYIYPESAGMVAGWTAVHDGRISYVLRAIANSPHHTQDGQCADFFVMHNYLGAKSTARVHATFACTRSRTACSRRRACS